MMAAAPPGRLHTAEEVAEILRCKSVRWVREKARLRLIPFTLAGGTYGFTDAHIAEIIKIFEQQPVLRQPSHAPSRRKPAGAAAQDAAVLPGPVLKARTPRRLRGNAA